jgi:hypothetical protein
MFNYLVHTLADSATLQDSGLELLPAATTYSLQASSTQLQVSLPIPTGAYLPPGPVITVAIRNATVSSPAEAAGLAAGISATDGSVQVIVPDEVANIAVGFTVQSLSPSVNEG